MEKEDKKCCGGCPSFKDEDIEGNGFCKAFNLTTSCSNTCWYYGEHNVLVLHNKAKWYEMIESGEKKEEYREIKEYWTKRLSKKKYDIVKFVYGYTRRTMMFHIKSIEESTGKEEWGAEKDKKYYVIKLGNMLKRVN